MCYTQQTGITILTSTITRESSGLVGPFVATLVNTGGALLTIVTRYSETVSSQLKPSLSYMVLIYSVPMLTSPNKIIIKATLEPNPHRNCEIRGLVVHFLTL